MFGVYLNPMISDFTSSGLLAAVSLDKSLEGLGFRV